MSEPGSARITTVAGPIEARQAGLTLAHEHVLSDLWGMTQDYDGILDDEEVAIKELLSLVEAGCRTVVDCTTIGIGRKPAALRRISQATGLNIVMGTGWYRERVYPAIVRESSVEELADILVGEIEVGVDDSPIRAGFIGEIGTERGRISSAEERVFRASALAQRRTGVAIITHTTNGGELGLEQVELLIGCGVPPDRIAISHVGDNITFGRLCAIAESGVYLSIDNIGYVGRGYPSDKVRADNVGRLLAEGHGARILISGDTCTRSALRAYGGDGYDRVLNNFVPQLRTMGATSADIESMMVHNPMRLLAIEMP